MLDNEEEHTNTMSLLSTLESNLFDELKLMRHLLDNIRRETHAISSENIRTLAQILKERLDIIEAIENIWAPGVVERVINECKEQQIMEQPYQEITHLEFIKLLSQLYKDNIDLGISLDSLQKFLEEATLYHNLNKQLLTPNIQQKLFDQSYDMNIDTYQEKKQQMESKKPKVNLKLL